MTDWVAGDMKLAELAPQSRLRLASLLPVTLPAHTPLFHAGDAVQGYAMVLSGRVDVSMTGASGREMLLYSVEPGQSCIQTTMGLLGGEDYTAEAETMVDTRLVLLPKSLFLSLMDSDPAFRELVFRAFAHRFQNMMQLLEKIAFTRVECRLAERLLALSADTPVLHLTQSDLATQVGTAREVVSRRLENWSRHGWVRTGRGTVEILDPQALLMLSKDAM
ncbi:Crp/Fnr family transcriptional regulator [Thalassovita sp.]|uniref:Crp/Fnr family transcriptional regulator n=1 Tax=Thalassovita sp. TaxID=1979401 RepID=UPI002882758D|nr:Crp/Fnr family transcriptional regulator [Thalassovita sp.]MDF1801614.1 Crp/Fnr family transcriptional regulator [Thalassovita sp.]